jgi:hypothetical protein
MSAMECATQVSRTISELVNENTLKFLGMVYRRPYGPT